MEKGEMVMKMGDGTIGSSSFSGYNPNSYPFSSVSDLPDGEKNSLGFMDLLNMQDFGPLLDFPQEIPSSTVVINPSETDQGSVKEYCSDEVLNLRQRQQQQPATPNSSSVSTTSSTEGGVNDEQTKTTTMDQEVEDEEHQNKTKKQLKAKKTNQKKQREPRFAFMTKSEVDHLEDGYRWRKYGQKAVKHSPFPSASCNVKKRVERSYNDPSIVVTTYEGQHTHPSPVVMPRPTSLAGAAVSTGCATKFASTSMPRNLYQYNHHQQQQPLVNKTLSSLSFHSNNYNGPSSAARMNNAAFLHCNQGAAVLRDHGLLQDIVSSHMLKEEHH
ncbi:WRKY transcription factor [Quillaja saponaria]|uniref:WRKY transcription factor n=1 Tax=Quillaja saponaria TaxID=32244 RepID=A0AAD7QA51_QUISA|nr:WRKY transcription factor [Quillaja saponaria]